MLTNQIDYPEIIFHFDKLYLTQFEVNVRSIPFPILLFRLPPFFGKSQYKSTAPATNIIADVYNDFYAGPIGVVASPFK